MLCKFIVPLLFLKKKDPFSLELPERLKKQNSESVALDLRLTNTLLSKISPDPTNSSIHCFLANCKEVEISFSLTLAEQKNTLKNTDENIDAFFNVIGDEFIG